MWAHPSSCKRKKPGLSMSVSKRATPECGTVEWYQMRILDYKAQIELLNCAPDIKPKVKDLLTDRFNKKIQKFQAKIEALSK